MADSQRAQVLAVIREALEPWLFGVDTEDTPSRSLPDRIRAQLAERKQTLLVLDVVSHGHIALDLAGTPQLQGSIMAPTISQLAERLGYDLEDTETGPEQLAMWARQQHGVDCVLLAVWQESGSTGNSDRLRCMVASATGVRTRDYPLSEYYRGHYPALSALVLDGLRRLLDDPTE
jgi:CheY-like chemotaxis protein